jgi:hypothetical protein
MFRRNRDWILSIGIQSPGLRRAPEETRDVKLDSIEQKLGNIETKLEQIRQMVLEQQSRPAVTVEQIRQLIQEQSAHRNRRQGRPLGRAHHHGEEEGKVIEETIGVKKDTHLNKSESQLETSVKVAETTRTAVGKALNIAKEKMSEVHQKIETVVALEPASEPPNPSVSNRCVIVLPKRVPLPKPPDPESCGDGKGSLAEIPPPLASPAVDSTSKELPMTSTKVMEKKRRVEWVSYMVGPDLTWMRKEDQRANSKICKLGIFLKLRGQMYKSL